jgi:acetoacetate decarboxylase
MFKFSEDLNYSMPAHFGGYKGSPKPLSYKDVATIRISYETDAELLAQYVPEDFEITQAVVTVAYAMCREVDWMAGGGYSLISVSVPVAYAHAGQRIEGQYILVIWENKTCPILGGRETTGIPKVFADIEDHHQIGNRAFTNASYEGREFLRIEFQIAKPIPPEALATVNQKHGHINQLGWRYIPNIGGPGAALSHATLYPVDIAVTAGWLGEGRVDWQTLTWEQHPTQAHIVRALAQLPVKANLDCAMTRGSQVLRLDLARQLP